MPWKPVSKPRISWAVKTEVYRATPNMYNTTRWRKYRRWYLDRHPLCVQCKKEGKITPSTTVDHIRPILSEDDPLFWDEENHQALCTSCHGKKKD